MSLENLVRDTEMVKGDLICFSLQKTKSPRPGYLVNDSSFEIM